MQTNPLIGFHPFHMSWWWYKLIASVLCLLNVCMLMQSSKSNKRFQHNLKFHVFCTRNNPCSILFLCVCRKTMEKKFFVLIRLVLQSNQIFSFVYSLLLQTEDWSTGNCVCYKKELVWFYSKVVLRNSRKLQYNKKFCGYLRMILWCYFNIIIIMKGTCAVFILFWKGKTQYVVHWKLIFSGSIYSNVKIFTSQTV